MPKSRSALAVAALRVSLLALATSCIGTNDFDRPIPPSQFMTLGKTTVDPPTPGILQLTFDDGPGPYTRDIIDTLNRHRALATFFMVGKNIPGYRDVVDYMRASGHQTANHSYFHAVQPTLSESVFKYQLAAVKENIGDTDFGRLYFRFPYGAAEPLQLQWLSEVTFDGHAYLPVGWNADSQDFTFRAPPGSDVPLSQTVEELDDCEDQPIPFASDMLGFTQYIARKVGGGIILFHDIQELTRDLLEEILNGYERPERYWASVAPQTAAAYRKFYACESVPLNTVFRFEPIHSGSWPTYR